MAKRYYAINTDRPVSTLARATDLARKALDVWEYMGCAKLPVIIYEQSGRNPPEPVAIWSRA